VGVDALDHRRRDDRDVVVPAEGVAGVDAVAETLAPRGQRHGKAWVSLFGRGQGGHVLALLRAVGHPPPQAAAFDGIVGDRDMDLHAPAFGQDGVAGFDGEHVGRDVRQVQERGDGPGEQARHDRGEHRPQGAEDHQDADRRQHERPGLPERDLQARLNAAGVAAGLFGEGCNQDLGPADLRHVVAGQQFDRAAEAFMEFRVAGFE